ncbi:Protocadherin Fat 3 [Holothuria leucospilota]|uniref:Protocadherin Fat 3 n=1 Tax=Holothuria leucospilota TaxID=206669 RepID=A0A9Q1H6U3_HOLLE|nr:Protocadherin Fat 3 [Holothuria leucospilota]
MYLCFAGINPCSANPCRNGGFCTISPTNCSEFMCICPDCFTGPTCELAVDHGTCLKLFCPHSSVQDPCSNHACQNDAECVPVPGSCTEYKCACTSGCSTGPFCEIRKFIIL